jgi:aryl-alcohol dehydrogenase-like predicted oxidoreductase
MEHVRLGKSGLQVTPLCLGMMTYGDPNFRDWVLDEAAARPLVQAAVDAGITFYDTADMYSAGVSEVVTGNLLRDMLPRDELVLATKVFNPVKDKPNCKGLSRKHILTAIDDSLQRLKMDYVDLYQIHRWDYHTPIEETMEALHDVVRAGKARYIGASSMFAWQFAKAQFVAEQHGWTKFISMQGHYNLLYREEEREMNPLCRDQGVGLIPWSPMARGRLARPAGAATTRAGSDDLARKLYDQADEEIIARLARVAEDRGVSRATVALAWHFSKGVVAPIIGVSKPGQLEDALKALEVRLTAEEVALLEEPYRPRPVLGHG